MANLEYDVSRQAVLGCLPAKNRFVFHVVNATAVGSNPEQVVLVLVNAHDVFVCESVDLAEIFYASVPVNHAKAVCRSYVYFAGLAFYRDADFVSRESVVRRPGFYLAGAGVVPDESRL